MNSVIYVNNADGSCGGGESVLGEESERLMEGEEEEDLLITEKKENSSTSNCNYLLDVSIQWPLTMIT